MRFDEDIKRVVKNSLYLLAAQGVSYLAPLLVLGHLIKTLGVSGFGKYAFILAIMAYLQVAIDYGFSFTASRDIAQRRHDQAEVSRIFWHVTAIKIALSLGILFFASAIFILTKTDHSLVTPYLFAYLLMLGNALLPVWYFQGTEQFKTISALNITNKLCGCLLVLFFVRSPNDLSIVLLAQALPNILVAIFSYISIFLSGTVKFHPITLAGIKHELKNGHHIFSATLASILLSNSGTFALGIIYPPSIVGAYAIVERIIKAIVSLFSPFTQAAYPLNSSKFAESFSKGVDSVIRTGKPILGLAAASTILTAFAMNICVTLLKWPPESLSIAYVLSFWIFLGVANNVLGIQWLSASGENRRYSKSFHIAAIATLSILLPMAHIWKGFGAAIALTFGEALLTMLLIQQIRTLLPRYQEIN